MNKSLRENNPLETDEKFSFVYTLAFGKETSKYNIQKYLTKSHRHTTIVDKYKEYFEITKRKDKKMGYLIKSKPELLISFISKKTYIDPITQSNLKKFLTNKYIEKKINKATYTAVKNGYRPINHFLLIRYLIIIFIGKYVSEEYKRFFKPKISEERFLEIYHDLDKKFLPEFYSKDDQKRHDKYSREMQKLADSFNHETMGKIIRLHPSHKLLLRLTKAGILLSKSLS
jgi:hypothetical protein